jgi:O-Antigen ligase
MSRGHVRERLGFALFALYLLGFLLAPSSARQQNVWHDAVFYLGVLPWAFTAGLGAGVRAIRQSALLQLGVALVLYLGASAVWTRGDLKTAASDVFLHAIATLGFLIAAGALLSSRRIADLCSAFVLAGGASALCALLAFAAGRVYPVSSRLHSAFNFEHPNLFAHALGFAVLLALDRWLRAERPRLAIVLVALMMPALLLTRGRLALAALLVATATLLAYRRGRTAWLALGALALALAVVPLLAGDLANEAFERADAGRGFIYEQLLERASAHPIIGLGLRARDDVVFPPGSPDFPAGTVLTHAHSAFVGTFFFGGLLGLLLLAALALCGLRSGLRLARNAEPLPLALLVYGLGCLLLDGHRLVGRPHLTSFLLLWLPLVLIVRWPASVAPPPPAPLPAAAMRWHPVAVTVAVLVLLAAQLGHLRGPIAEPHAERQLDAFFVAHSFALAGIDGARPPVAWLGPRGIAVVDFPLAEGLWSVFFRQFGERVGAARLVQFTAFAAAMALLAALCRSLALRGVAVWAVLIAAGTPLALVYSRALVPEQLALALGLGGAVAGLRYLDRGGLRAASATFGLLSLAMLSAPHWCVGWLAFLTVCALRVPRRRGLVTVGLLVGALALALGYQAHAFAVNAAAPGWGTLHGLTVPWLQAIGFARENADLWRIGSSLSGDLIGLPLLLPAAAGMALALRAGRQRLCALVSCHILAFLLHLRAAASHDYDLLPLIVPFALLAGLGLATVARAGRVGRALALGTLALAFAGNLHRAAELSAGNFGESAAVAGLLRRETPPDAVVAVSWGELSWRSPLVLVPAERRGFMLPGEELSPATLALLQALGATHLAIVTKAAPSPAQASALRGRPSVPYEAAKGIVVYVEPLAPFP